MKVAAWITGLLFLLGGQAQGAPTQTLSARIAEITGRAAVKHTLFGILIYDLDRKTTVYARNADALFLPASTTKLLTEGTSLNLLGADYRFITNVYRTGVIDAQGVLDGDLILRATGDPNLSGRIRPDGTLAFENEDHSYDGNPDTRAVPGDPLLVLRGFAKQIAAAGVKRVRGRVLVDATLFPEGEHEAGTGAVISPVVLNDNIVDITVAPGSSIGDAASVSVSPQTPYVRVIDDIRTAAPATKRSVDVRDAADADGNRVVTLTGSLPLRSPSILYGYDVPSPRRFAEVALAQALRDQGVDVDAQPQSVAILAGQYAPFYTAANLVATHTSPPLSQDVKVTLKVSDNLHADIMPYLWGIVGAHAQNKQLEAGFNLERAFLRNAGLDVAAAAQSDGLGGQAWFTPRFMVSYLAFMRKQPTFSDFYAALPVMGRDGTLFKIQRKSPAAGNVHAKTGTWGGKDLLNRRSMITAKGLAGYMTTQDGRHLAFCFYLNNMPVAEDLEAGHTAGEVLGELATAAYLFKP